MPKCKDCGNKKKFNQHGYPKDFQVRMSCGVCKSDNVKNTFVEMFFWYLQWCIVIVIISPFLVFIVPYFIAGRKFNKDENGNEFCG